MFDCFLAQMLVLTFIFFSSSRVFFLKHSRVDCFAAFSPAALIISFFIFYCFDFSILSFAVFLLALISFFTNFRATLRLYAKLIVDSYSVVFNIFSIIILILTVLLAIGIIYFRPVKYSASDFDIKKTQYTLTGTSANLRIRESYFSGASFSGNLFSYEPIIKDDIIAEFHKEKPTIIFTPGIHANVQNYEPYLMLLAQKGYPVLAADFYTNDLQILAKYFDNKVIKSLVESKFMRKFTAIHIDKTQKEEFSKIHDDELAVATKKYSALTKLALELFGDETKVFYVVDGVDFDSIYAVIDEFNTEPYSNAKGFFSMNRVDEYKTSGYGFIEQTDVFLAHTKGIERENKFFIPRYVANKTIKAIEEQK